MFKERLLSGIVLMIIAIVTIVLGGNVLFATVLAISLIGMMELFRVFKFEKKPVAMIGYAGCIGYYFTLLFAKESLIMYFIFYLLVIMIFYVVSFPRYDTSHVTVLFFGLFYVAVMLSYIYQVRMLDDGAYLVWLIFISAWGSDTCAYCVGKLIGKHKVTPHLSPKKSVEGCIGGVVGAALIGVIYAAIFHENIIGFQSVYLAFALIGGCGSVISQIGDLAASAIKRQHEIKDYGKLIPGHGGILDRFDSIIFTAPIVYYLVSYFAA